jgi:hypothetical protein
MNVPRTNMSSRRRNDTPSSKDDMVNLDDPDQQKLAVKLLKEHYRKQKLDLTIGSADTPPRKVSGVLL